MKGQYDHAKQGNNTETCMPTNIDYLLLQTSRKSGSWPNLV